MPARDVLKPERLKVFKRLEIMARRVVEGFITGLHESPYKGFAVEFAEHRPYVQGDDLKHLDWKLFAKHDRYYIKQYEEETNLTATILLDGSESMKLTVLRRTLAAYSGFTQDLGQSKLADEALRIGPAPALESYLVGENILDAARRSGASKTIPGAKGRSASASLMRS